MFHCKQLQVSTEEQICGGTTPHTPVRSLTLARSAACTSPRHTQVQYIPSERCFYDITYHIQLCTKVQII